MASKPLGRKGRGGFSFVELLFAIATLLLSLLGALLAELSAVNLVRTSRETAAASADLRAAMEQILLLPPANITAAGGPFEPGVPIAAFSGLHLRGESMVPEYPGYVPGEAVPDPLPIILRISWTDFAGRPRTTRLATMRTR
ncbi:MAG TPA: hypothetical protein VFI25_06785 [Planctomycetota bacterium]|nr:hypothetical protein [Planctomycetota bacterium]